MEAKTYLQMAKDNFSILFLSEHLTSPYLLSCFYSKTFSQSMIEELFKFWKPSEFKNDYESVSNSCIYFNGNSHYSIRVDKNDPITGVSLPLPKTLDDFIRDCERAGVVLFWREEIITKYFQ